MQRHESCVYNAEFRAAQLGNRLDQHVVICETDTARVVIMAVTREISAEIHKHMTQCFTVTQGSAVVELYGGTGYPPMQRFKISKNMSVVVPPGVRHRIINDDIPIIPLRLHIIYSKSTTDAWE